MKNYCSSFSNSYAERSHIEGQQCSSTISQCNPCCQRVKYIMMFPFMFYCCCCSIVVLLYSHLLVESFQSTSFPLCFVKHEIIRSKRFSDQLTLLPKQIRFTSVLLSSKSDDDNKISPISDEVNEILSSLSYYEDDVDLDNDTYRNDTRRQRIRKRMSEIAQRISPNSGLLKKASNSAIFVLPQAVAAVIKDATINAVEIALEEIMSKRSSSLSSISFNSNQNQKLDIVDDNVDYNKNSKLDSYYITSLVDEAFLPMEKSLNDMEESLQQSRISLQTAKQQARNAIEKIQKETILSAATTNTISLSNITTSSISVEKTINKSPVVTTSSFDDVDFMSSEMAPPYLDEDQCLIPGEPIIRIEKAPENSRRIFAGIDIMASVDDVWNLLTNYSNLQNVIPNLVVNEVLELYNYEQISDSNSIGTIYSSSDMNTFLDTTTLPEDEQCRMLCEKMKGSKLRQVGGAKVAGIQFSARTTLEVREWPNGMPDFAHFCTGGSINRPTLVGDGDERNKRAKELMKIPLERYKFPRPFAISSLPTKDISMQSILNDDGEFRIYQGVWRMQPLPGCAPTGFNAMRLTYAVQISPRSYLPVALIENRIVRDLCTNLVAIRNVVCNS